ncbi:hypothetical protein LINPERHAP1_LOCUS21245 [Linum perenne]
MVALGEDTKFTIFMTGHFVRADNEEGTIESHVDLESDSYVENSIVTEFIYLFDDDIRTSDDQFEEALFTMGVRKTRARVPYVAYSSGEEVEQVIGVQPGSGQGAQPGSGQGA